MNGQFTNENPNLSEAPTLTSNNNPASTQSTKVCSQCKATLAAEQDFCHLCGATAEKAPAQNSTCLACGTVIPPETNFCPKCGKSVLPDSKTLSVKKKSKMKLFVILGCAALIIASVIVLCLVLFKEVPVEAIVLSETKIELKEEESKSISCAVYPKDATDKAVIWNSSDESVATVNEYGMITATGRGTCSITAKAGEFSETISVTVKANIDFEKLYNDFCVSTWATLGNDKSYLSIDSNPYDYEDGDYRYSSTVIDTIEKINKALNFPDSLFEDMLQTSWGIGKQVETFDDIGVTVTWIYHPDKGLEVTYKLINN